MSHDLAATWLKVTSLFIVLLGLLVALGAHPSTSLPATLLADTVFWPLDGTQAIDTQAARVLAAIAGGVMVGWGVMIWLVVDRLRQADPKLARFLIIEATLAWYIVDSTGSFVSGAGVNVLLNTVLMLAIVLPAWRIGAARLARTT
ncbi:MAG: hypothetical protein ACJLUP_21700 [Agrobacterium tumefaciens]|jgi:hypothetical protein